MDAIGFVWKSALIIVLIFIEHSIREQLGLSKKNENRTFGVYLILYTGWRVLDGLLEYFKL